MTDCEHDSYEMVGKFPDGMFVDGECMANYIICDECGKRGKESYHFVERTWEDEDGVQSASYTFYEKDDEN